MTAINVPSGCRAVRDRLQVVQLLHGALHRFTSATMDAISSPPPIASSDHLLVGYHQMIRVSHSLSIPRARCRMKLRVWLANHGLQDASRELAPNCCPDLWTPSPGPSRSSRAINDAWRLAGTRMDGDGIVATALSAARSPPASRPAFVTSSTNSGMPSVRSIMSCLTVANGGLLPVTRSILAAISRSPSRLRLSARHDTATLFDWLAATLVYQGISDQVAAE